MAADRWGLSWAGTTGAWGVAWNLGFGPVNTVPEYGPPFLTVTSPMFDTISKRSEIITTITRSSEINEDS